MPTLESYSSAPTATHRKTTACVALFDLGAASANLVTDCFRQFGMETSVLSQEEAFRLHTEKFDACVLPLGPAAGSIIELARASASNSRIVIFGLGGTMQDAMRYSKLCINTVFQEPLERSAALKLVRSTRTLVMHEFRRYVRIPVMTEVAVAPPDGGRFTASSKDISCGGMALKSGRAPDPGSILEVSFALLTLPRVSVRGHVAWRKADKTFGIQFDTTDVRRQRLKDWIVGYLDN